MRWGHASDVPRYRCKVCKRTFNALTKTPLANLRMKDKWASQTQAMIDGVSTAKAAARCGVHYTTAFRWRHRFLASLAGDKPKGLIGIVEGDETFILESFKGKRSGIPRKPRKRGGKSAKRGLSAEQIPVIVARDRQGATTDAVLAATGPCVDHRGPERCHHAEQRVLLRRRHGDSRLRANGPGSQRTSCRSRATGPAKRAGLSPQQRQRLSRPTEGMAAPLPRRRHEKPAELSRLAPGIGGVGRQRHAGHHDPRCYRNGAIPTKNAIRAKEIDGEFRSDALLPTDGCGIPHRLVLRPDRPRAR